MVANTFKRLLLGLFAITVFYVVTVGRRSTLKRFADSGQTDYEDGVPERAVVPTLKSLRSRLDRPLLYWRPINRLGNLLFEYTSAFCTAVLSNHTPTIGETSSLLSLFQIKHAKKVSQQQQEAKRPAVREKYCCYRQPHILEWSRAHRGEVIIKGYFQSFKYMLPCWAELGEELILTDNIQDRVDRQMVEALLDYYYANTTDPAKKDSNALSLLQEGRLPTTAMHTFVGVHIRRKDRTSTYPPVEFFVKAFRHFEGKFKQIIFFICSDDIEWAKKELPSLVGRTSGIVFVSDRTKDYEVDFGVLMSCNHSIVTAGTFSWWSGWLAGGEVIYFEGRGGFKPDTYQREDYFPAHWIPME